ncbi:ATP binding [Tulasnella sp. 332]|nr:ATP binding [Tulasnella sp. 332]
MSNLTNRKSPTSPHVATRPSTGNGRPPSRPPTPSGTVALNGHTSLDPPSGQAYRTFISTWTDGHVAQWLTEAKCAKVVPTFRANHIRGDVVLDLDQVVLKEMGITSVGDRIKILSAVKSLRQRCSGTRASTSTGSTLSISSTLSSSLSSPKLMLNNGQEPDGSMSNYMTQNGRSVRSNGEVPRSPSMPNTTMMNGNGTPPATDNSSSSNRSSMGSTGRRSDRPPPLHLAHSAHSTQRDLPQIISANSGGGNLTASLAPPVSATSMSQQSRSNNSTQHSTLHQASSTGNLNSGRDRERSDKGSLPALPPAPRTQAPLPPSTTSASFTLNNQRSNRSLHPSHGRDHSQSQSHSPAATYAAELSSQQAPGTASSASWVAQDYNSSRGQQYAFPSGRASPQPHSRSGTSRPGERGLTHQKNGSSGTVGNLIAGLKGSGDRMWSSGAPGGSHPYAAVESQSSLSVNTSLPTTDLRSPAGNGQESAPVHNHGGSGYSVGRGPFSRPGTAGHHSQASGGNALTLEDLRRRTIKFNLGEPGMQTKLMRTIDISDCESGVQVLQAALRKFGKGGINSAEDGSDFRELEGGGLVVEGWGAYLEGPFGETTGKPVTEAELLALCHADASNSARDKLTLRRIRVAKTDKLQSFFGEQPPPPPVQISPTSPTYVKTPRRYEDEFDQPQVSTLRTPSPAPRASTDSRKLYRASTISIMSGLGAGTAWNAPGAHTPPMPPPPLPPLPNTIQPGSTSLHSPTPSRSTTNSVQAQARMSATNKIRHFLGQRPPSEIIYTHQQEYFPTAERKVLERTATARKSMFGGNSKRLSTVSALGSIGIGGAGSDENAARRSTGKHRSRVSVSSNGSGLTPAQIVAAANKLPPLPSPSSSAASPLKSPDGAYHSATRTAIEEAIPRMSVSTEDGNSVDLVSDDDDYPPPTAVPSKPLLLPPVSIGGETLSESLSADFARSTGGSFQQSANVAQNKRLSVLQELRTKKDKSDTASMLTLDEITEKVESRRQSMMGASMMDDWGVDDRASLAPSSQPSVYSSEDDEDGDMVIDPDTIPEEDEEEYEEDEDEDDEKGDEEDEEEAEADDDGYGKATTSTGSKRVIKWIKGALIGAGSFGSVYLGMDAQHGLLMAVKQVELPRGSSNNEERKKSMLTALEREIALLKELSHEYIVQYLDSSMDDAHLNIFLEYVPGGSVATLLRNYGAFEEALVRNWVRQILIGLNYLHERDIIHRDIKGANILVDNRGGIKISDFGISKKLEDDMMVTGRNHRASLQGSVFWMAPEVVKQSGHSSKADIWSVGCVVVEMLTGEHPYPKASQMQAIFRIGSYAKPDNPPDITPEAEDFLSKSFEIDLNARPSAVELLLHPWVAAPISLT